MPSTRSCLRIGVWVTVITLGAILRLLWIEDMEYKADERFMFERLTQSWPSLGMPSGVETRNPAMSVWIFMALSQVFNLHTPPDLALAVGVLGALTIALGSLFIYRVVEPRLKEAWSWAFAFFAVNPISVLYGRKIWAQSTLPIFSLLLFWAWWRRGYRWGAFFWGLIGCLIGQIHMSGFFFSAALWCWTIRFKKNKNCSWPFWALGTALGVIPLVPWLEYLATNPYLANPSVNFSEIPQLRFWVFWVSNALGLHLGHSLGLLTDFFRYPLIAGQPTYLILAAHAVIVGVGVKFIWAFGKDFFSTWSRVETSQSRILEGAALWGLGLLMTGLAMLVRRHYLIVAFPLLWFTLARTLLSTKNGTRWLLALFFAQTLISAQFLWYIHINHGAKDGDYGIAYQYQGKTKGIK